MRGAPLQTLTGVRQAGKAGVARTLTAIETAADETWLARLLDEAVGDPRGYVLGLTGPPGVGKSTLTSTLLRRWRNAGRTVAVLAVDPSSRRSGGALLGDRTRMKSDPSDDGVFIRSMAARDRLGGLSDHAIAATALLRAIYDMVLVETVGIGQSEGDIALVADTIVLCVQPGSGDSLQFMKAGIMELPHVVAVTKADMGGRGAPGRRRCGGRAVPEPRRIRRLDRSRCPGFRNQPIGSGRARRHSRRSSRMDGIRRTPGRPSDAVVWRLDRGILAGPFRQRRIAAGPRHAVRRRTIFVHFTQLIG